MTYTFPFSQLNKSNIPAAGGKGANLGEMTSAGFPVPGGFVLTTETYYAFMQAHGLQQQIVELAQTVSGDNPQSSEAASAKIKQLFLGADMPAKIAEVVMTASAELGEVSVAVRSSATAEDLPDASFAGQQETYLNVQGKDAILDAVKQCWASLWTARAITYRIKQEITPAEVSLAVVVQQHIESEVSGVAFSLNPNNNAFDEAMINASFGLGEAIVSGQVTPDTYVVDKVSNEILQKQLATKDYVLVSKAGGGMNEKALDDPNTAALTDAQVLEVTKLVTKVEAHYDVPMDIEWAIEGGILYLLQARPITTYNPFFPEMITQPGERKNLYVDLNILTQGFFDPVSELGLDIWSRMLPVSKGGAMPKGFDGAFFDVGGREYIHVSNMAVGMIPSLAGFSNYDMDIREVFKSLDMEGEYIAPVKTEKMKQVRKDALRVLFRMIPRMLGGMFNPDKATREFEQSLESAFRYYKQDLLKGGTFGEMVQHGVEEEFGKMIDSVAGGGISTRVARKNLEKLFKDQGVDELIGLLSAASPTNPTAQMGHKMLELASFAELQDTATEDEFVQRLVDGDYSQAFMDAYNDYMERFGARGFKEIDIATPRVYEKPRAFYRQLKALNIEQYNESALEERKQAAYQQLLELAKKLGKEKQFVSTAQRYMTRFGFREAPKYMFVVMIGELRKRALELGQQFVSQGRLASPEQLFDLTVDQVSEAETNPTLDIQFLREKNLVPRQAVAHIKDWPKIVDSRGKIFRYIRPSEDGDLAGEPISAGVVRGKAKVLTSPYEKPLEKGEILVTRTTEPAWTPVFFNAAGVVLEIGGPLQHGAIIARENNLPCVSGIHGVTELIKDGDLLEVDGTSGIVKIIKNSNVE